MSEEVCSWTLKDRLGHYHLRCYLENELSFLRRLKTGPKITTDIKLRIDRASTICTHITTKAASADCQQTYLRFTTLLLGVI